MNAFARRTLRLYSSELGKPVLHYHAPKNRNLVTCLLRQTLEEQSGAPVAMIIDVLSKVLMISVSKLETADAASGPFFVASFVDVTAQTGATVNPDSRLIELKKFPIYHKKDLLFLDARSIYFFAADKNYCRVFSADDKYYVQLTLKQVLQRCTGPAFVMVHKSYVVNLEHVSEIRRDHTQYTIVFDRKDVPHVPVARRRLHDLKAALGLIRPAHADLAPSSQI
jgi:DNA-binding LytR/AlgR family response regulator